MICKGTKMGTRAAIATLAVFAASSALAQHAHSDVEVSVENGALTIENGIAMLGGGVLFEAEFGELGNPTGADEPGFELDDGNFLEDEILAFEAFGSLMRWDGSDWVSTGTDPVQIAAYDVLGNETLWDGSGVSNSVGWIDSADDEGGVHHHIEFEIQDSGGGMPVAGAYMIELALFGIATDQTTQAYGHSGSMFIAFNFGLDEDDFEMAVDALAAQVPVPGAVLFMMSGLLSMFGLRRRRDA